MENLNVKNNVSGEVPAEKKKKKSDEFSLEWHLKVLAVIYIILGIFYILLKVFLK